MLSSSVLRRSSGVKSPRPQQAGSSRPLRGWPGVPLGKGLCRRMDHVRQLGPPSMASISP